jgi:hypothetical protein
MEVESKDAVSANVRMRLMLVPPILALLQFDLPNGQTLQLPGTVVEGELDACPFRIGFAYFLRNSAEGLILQITTNRTWVPVTYRPSRIDFSFSWRALREGWNRY